MFETPSCASEKPPSPCESVEPSAESYGYLLCAPGTGYDLFGNADTAPQRRSFYMIIAKMI